MEALRPAGQRLRERFVSAVLDGSMSATDLPGAYAASVDEWLAGVFAEAVGGRSGFALVAVGGYGRGELCPGSDLDLTLLHDRRRTVASVADHIWYAIWDSGIRLDHSVRTPREAMTVARDDHRALLGLLDGRVVAGEAALADELLEGVDEWWRTHARQLVPQLDAARRERHERFGEIAFLLEPDLKESGGGLRDIDALSVAGRAVPALAAAISPERLRDHRRLLTASRAALHARAAGARDRLLLQEQDGVALLLGYADADALMADLAVAGREVTWVTADGWRRLESQLAGPLGRSGGRDTVIGPGVVLRDGEVAAGPGAVGFGDGTLLLAVAGAAAEYAAPIATATLERLSEAAPVLAEPWSSEIRQSFVSVLEYGPEAVAVLETLDHYGLLERLLPEWGAVRHRPQRNAYHRFTVDRHLLEATAEAARLIRSVPRPDLLLVGALLHDIGKVGAGDHSEVGREIAVGVARRMGFDEGDVGVLGRVVQHHLALAEMATRRDIDDPATVDAIASRVGDRLTLDVLAALTEADSIATGPTAWSAWKAELVGELAARTRTRLAGAEPAVGQRPGPTPRQLELASRGSLHVELSGTLVTVVAPDRPGLLSLVAGTLALHRLDVRSAELSDDGAGTAIDVFEVAGAQAAVRVDVDALRADIARALDGELLLAARLADLERGYARSRRPAAARPTEVRVLVDAEASSHSTVVEVRAPNSRGLLYRLTHVFADAGLDVVSAHVSTIGHEVVDAFYVRDASSRLPLSETAAADLPPRLAAVALP